jgi:D-alanyl-D-alanine dipeptidase
MGRKRLKTSIRKLMKFQLYLFLLLLVISCRNNGPAETISAEEVKPEVTADVEPVDEVFKAKEYPGWLEFTINEFYHLDIRYATENNFVEEAMYECGRCFLRKEAGEALKKVAESLKQINYKLVLFDCYRPKPVQQKLWDKVPDPSYVTPPNKGSMHNRGVAVDLSIMDKNGEYLDMGTTYDFFGKEAHTDNLDLPKEVLKNRKLLNDLMVKYGFKGIRTEWWHFSFVDGSYEIADWEWDCL